MSSFQTEELEKFIKIKCPKVLDADASLAFANQSKAWMLKPKEHFVVDFAGVLEISRDFYRVIIQLKTSLKKDQKSIHSANLSPTLALQIREDGVEAAFNPIKAPEEAFEATKSTSTANGQLNVEFLNPFLNAIQKTFEVQCKTKVQVQKPQLKKGPLEDVAITGVLALSSNGFSGSIVLCFSKAVFLKIYQNMFDEKHEVITPEIEDAAGELLNIIYGTAKIELNTKGYSFQKALPTVLTGEKIVVRQSGPGPAVIIPVETDFGRFQVEVEFN